MKDAYNFILWQWTKWKLWQKVYAASMASLIVGFLLPGIIGALLLVVGATSLLSWLFKWAVWDSVTTSYEEFKKEKEDGQDKDK